MAEHVNNQSSSRSNDIENFFDQYISRKDEENCNDCMECFQTFDTDRDGFLSRAEFNVLLERLFTNNGEPYPMSNEHKDAIFGIIDENQDNRIDLEEFKVCWKHWLKTILHPTSALLIIDVQNDFISGSLAIRNCPAQEDGEAVIHPINNCVNNAPFHAVIYSLDWHPTNHISFIENVKKRKLHHTSKVIAEHAKKLDTVIFAEPQLMEQKLWPAHCVQNTEGAKLHEKLKIVENAVYVNKGTNSDIDSYSAFWDNKKMSQTSLVTKLTERGVTDVYVCGLAYDICVGATTNHSLEHGFRTVLIEDACRGVDHNDIRATRDSLQQQGAVIATSEKVPDMVRCLDRRPELGHFGARNLAMARKLFNRDQHA